MSAESGDGSPTFSLVEPSTALLVHPSEGPIVAPSGLPPLPDALGEDATLLEPDLAELVAEQLPRLSARAATTPARRRTLRAGCYLLRFTPLPPATALVPLHYDGTLRVQRDGVNTIASGDLYLHRARTRPPFGHKHAALLSEPNPAAGIPLFARSRYRYYV